MNKKSNHILLTSSDEGVSFFIYEECAEISEEVWDKLLTLHPHGVLSES